MSTPTDRDARLAQIRERLHAIDGNLRALEDAGSSDRWVREMRWLLSEVGSLEERVRVLTGALEQIRELLYFAPPGSAATARETARAALAGTGAAQETPDA